MLTLLQVGFLLAAPPPACKGPAEIERVIAAKPTVGAYNALGAWFAQRQQFTCAITAFESALQLDPANLDTHYNFGIALFPDLAYFILFLPMVLVLVFMPQGLFGRVPT